MTATFKGQIESLSPEEANELISELVLQKAMLGLDAEITDVEAILALFTFIKEKTERLPQNEKNKLVRILRSRQESTARGQAKRCAHCWTSLHG